MYYKEKVQQNNFFKVEATFNILKKKNLSTKQIQNALRMGFSKKELDDHQEVMLMRDYYGND